MALGFHVAGPTLIEWATASSFASLGYTTDDERPQINQQRFTVPVTSQQYGQAPRELINVGMVARISATLIDFDETQLTALLAKVPGASTEGTSGTIGGLWVGATHASPARTFQLRITPTLSGEKQYTFPLCYLDENSVKIFEFGNAAKRVALDIPCIPNSSAQIYTVAAIA